MRSNKKHILIIKLLIMLLIVNILFAPFQEPQNATAYLNSQTYDFSKDASVDKWAWEKATKHINPDDTGSGSAGVNEYAYIANEDGLWITDLAQHNQYNSQMYKFTIKQESSKIEDIDIFWKGHGEQRIDYDTSIDIWNYYLGTWEQLDTQDNMGSIGWLSGGLNDPLLGAPQDYISEGKITIRAAAKHYESQPCPYLYGWNGKTFKLVDSTITNSFLKKYEGRSYDTVTWLETNGGYYDLMMHMSAPHTGYINNLKLWIIDHLEDTEIIMDASGTVHTIQDPKTVVAVDSNGRNVTSDLAEKGGGYWSSVFEGKDYNDIDNLHEWILITLPENEDDGIAKLIVDARWSNFGDLKIWYALHYLLGTPNYDYVLNRLDNDPIFSQSFDLEMWRTSAFIIQYWDGKLWIDYANVPHIGMFFGRPQIIPIDLSILNGNQIRILTPIGCHEIDYVAIDYTTNLEVDITELHPEIATKHHFNGITADALNEISNEDTSYVTIEKGDYVNCKYTSLPSKDGFERSFIFITSGYYSVDGPVVPEDKMYNLNLVESLLFTPYAYSQWILHRYLHPELYEYLRYYELSIIRPPFLVDWDALETDYVKVIITYHYSRSVGGIYAPMNKLTILAPYIVLVGLIGAISTIFGIRRWHKKN